MSNVPKPPKNDQITWFENHIPLWSSSPSTYGITPAALLVVSNATTAARAAYIAAQNSKQATKNAVVFQDSQVRRSGARPGSRPPPAPAPRPIPSRPINWPHRSTARATSS